MKRLTLLCGALAACAPVSAPAPELPFVRGYRAEADQCMLVGESDLTVEYLDDAADLVACPTDYEGLGVFLTETNARKVGTYLEYSLFSVPIR